MTNPAASIVEALLQQSERIPEQLCIGFEGQRISYGALRERVEAVARALHRRGLQSGERVALFMENAPDFLAAYLGTHLAGGIVVLVNTQYRQVELRHILSDAGVRLCFTNPALRPELERVRPELPALETVVETGADWDAFVADARPVRLALPRGEEVAVIAYTSGTTGRSKGAMLLHRNQTANIGAVCAAWRWNGDDHLLLTLPLFHVHGLMVGVHGTIMQGASAELRRGFNAAEVFETLLRPDDSRPVTMFFGVPTMYTRLLAEAAERGAPPPLRLYVSGSAPLSPQTFAEWERVWGQRILERYGMTETLMNCTNPYDGERRPGTVGQPFPGQAARVVQVVSREAAPPDVDGEIEVRGPHVFAGYWQRPDATADSFAPDGWFKTGDLGRVSADGYFTITGRAKELIISGGYNVYPREVEEVLASCPGVAEVAVVGLPDADLGEQVVAVVVRRAASLGADEVVAWSRERLASYKKPRRVIFVDALPRNALGKIQKHLVVEQLRAKT